MTDEERPWSNINKPGRMDVDGQEWWACDPYPTWYYWTKDHKLVRRDLYSTTTLTAKKAAFMDEVTDEMLDAATTEVNRAISRTQRFLDWRESLSKEEPIPEEDPSRYLIPGLRTHAAGECALKYCAIHNPSDHPLMNAPLSYRFDRGILERICKHGVGHDDPDDLAYRKSVGREADGVHGCCGCCAIPDLSTEGTTQ